MQNLIKVKTLKDALSQDCLYLSGGTEILRLNTSEDKNKDVIEILSLLDSSIKEEGEYIVIGAGCTFSSLLESSLVPSFLKTALRYMRSPELREMATLGGNIGAKKDDSFLIPALAAANAILLVLTKDGERELSIKEFLEHGGIIESIRVKKNSSVRLFRESITTHSHASVTLAKGESECFGIRGSGIFFSRNDIKYSDDITGSAEYKKYLVKLFLEGEVNES